MLKFCEKSRNLKKSKVEGAYKKINQSLLSFQKIDHEKIDNY